MQGDVTWDHFDRLVEAYAAASLFLGEVRELETRIARAVADLVRYPGTFDDMTALLATRAPSREMVARRVAWAAQHVVGKRAWCVGAKVLVKLPGGGRDAYASPVLDQLRLLGMLSAGEQAAAHSMGSPSAAAKSSVAQSSGAQSMGAEINAAVEDDAVVDVATAHTLDFEVPALDKIDALLCHPGSDEVWLFKGASYSQAERLSPELWVNADRDSLFGVDDRFMTRLLAPGSHIRTLLATRDLVQAAHPQLKVRAGYMVINDPGCSWHFQAHDLTSARPEVSQRAKVKLDEFPVLSTHRAFPDLFSAEGLELATLAVAEAERGVGEDGVVKGKSGEVLTSEAGEGAARSERRETAGGRMRAGRGTGGAGGTGGTAGVRGGAVLASLPADRPTRSLLLLHELWGRQLNRPRRLVTARGEDLAESVARHSGVALARDQWRHDLEDCLERSGFVRRLPESPGRFGITAKGVARLLVLRRKLGAGSGDVTAAQLLHHIQHQARLWAAAPVA